MERGEVDEGRGRRTTGPELGRCSSVWDLDLVLALLLDFVRGSEAVHNEDEDEALDDEAGFRFLTRPPPRMDRNVIVILE